MNWSLLQQRAAEFGWDGAEQTQASMARVSELLQLIVVLREYQYV